MGIAMPIGDMEKILADGVRRGNIFDGEWKVKTRRGKSKPHNAIPPIDP